MFNVRLAGGHLYGKQLFTWLSLVVSFMAYFVLSFFPLDVLDGIWDLIESVSEAFLTYSWKCLIKEQEIPSRWTEYCSELYNYESCGNNTGMQSPPEEDLQSILCEEVEIAVGSLKRGSLPELII